MSQDCHFPSQNFLFCEMDWVSWRAQAGGEVVDGLHNPVLSVSFSHQIMPLTCTLFSLTSQSWPPAPAWQSLCWLSSFQKLRFSCSKINDTGQTLEVPVTTLPSSLALAARKLWFRQVAASRVCPFRGVLSSALSSLHFLMPKPNLFIGSSSSFPKQSLKRKHYSKNKMPPSHKIKLLSSLSPPK